MMTRTTIIFFSLLLVFLSLPGCDAPKDHDKIISIPFDNPTVIDSFRVLTKHYPAPYPDPDPIICFTDARLTDPDGIDHVHLEIKDSLRINIEYDPESEHCTYSFLPEDFAYDITSFRGESFYLYVFDELGYVTKSEKQTISEILEYTPTLISPGLVSSPGDTTSNMPLFVWQQYESLYDVTYSLHVIERWDNTEVVTITGIPRVVDGSNDTVDSIRVSESLPGTNDNKYYWTLTVIDDKGNEAVSERLFFIATP